MLNDLNNVFRMATLATALSLAWFSVATIFAESLRPKPPGFSQVIAASPAPSSPGSLASWSAAAAPFRGDLIADVAMAEAGAILGADKVSASPEIVAARGAALSLARQSLSLAPHSSRTWLLVAKIQSMGPSEGSASEALRMSYLTSPADASLIPMRLHIVSTSVAIHDDDLRSLERSDIRLILTRRPDLKPAIVDAYRQGSTEGKNNMEEVVRSLDPSFAASLR